jgi:hypothetical protein
MLLQLLITILQISFTAFSPYATETKLQAMVFASIYGTGLLFRWNWDLNNATMDALNSMIYFEKTFFKGKNQLL